MSKMKPKNYWNAGSKQCWFKSRRFWICNSNGSKFLEYFFITQRRSRRGHQIVGTNSLETQNIDFKDNFYYESFTNVDRMSDKTLMNQIKW